MGFAFRTASREIKSVSLPLSSPSSLTPTTCVSETTLNEKPSLGRRNPIRKESWDLIGAALSRMDSMAHRLLLALEESYGELIPTNVLIDWARQHLPGGPGVAAQLAAELNLANCPSVQGLYCVRFQITDTF